MILWERDSRREPRGGQALGSRPSWCGGSSLALTLSPPWALLLAGGTSCGEREQGAPCTGSCVFSCVEPCGHSAQQPEPCPAVCAGSQTHQPSPLCTHTPPLHRPRQGRKTVDDLGALDSHWHRSQAPQESAFPPASPVLGCDHDSTTCYPVLTNPSPSRGETPSSPPSPTGEGMWSCPERAPRGGQAWTGLLAATVCHLRRPPGKRPEASGLRVEPLSTASEKPLQYGGTSKNYIKLL